MAKLIIISSKSKAILILTKLIIKKVKSQFLAIFLYLTVGLLVDV